MSKNKALRKISCLKRNEVTGEWGKLHNDEVYALYSSPNILQVIKTRKIRWARHVARMAEKRNAYSVLVRKSEGRRPFGRPRRRQEDNIKIELKLDGEGCVDWIEILQYRDKWRPLETL